MSQRGLLSIIKVWLFLLYLLNCRSVSNLTCLVIHHRKPECPECLSGLNLLNHQTFCYQTWYDDASSWARLSSGKIGFLSSRSRSQRGLIWSKYDCFCCIFWTADLVVTTLSQWMFIRKKSCELLNRLSQNLIWWCIIMSHNLMAHNHKLSVSAKRLHCCVMLKVKVTAKVHNFNESFTGSYLLKCWTLFVTKPVMVMHLMGQNVLGKDWLNIFKIKVTVRARITKYDCFYDLSIELLLLLLLFSDDVCQGSHWLFQSLLCWRWWSQA